MSSFKDQLDRAYKEKVVGQLERTVRAVALVVDAELVRTTPVDTGRARANWLPSLNIPNMTILPPAPKGGTVNRTANMATAIAAYKLADTILITNNLPYIQRLNDGYSQQAPSGFVDMAIAKGKRAVKQ